MTTPEQLLADREWRLRNSAYALWALVPSLGFIPLLYTGFRAKKAEWVLPGAVYGVLFVVIFFILGSVFDEDSAFVSAPGAALWIVSGIHVFLARRAWLRTKAETEANGPWYAPGPAVLPVPSVGPSAADLAEIDRIDPLSAHIDPAAPAPSLAPPIDLNTATADQVAAIFGAGAIGEVFARRIVEERDRLGRFGSVDQAAAAVSLEPNLQERLRRSAYVSGGQASTQPPPPLAPPPPPSGPVEL